MSEQEPDPRIHFCTECGDPGAMYGWTTNKVIDWYCEFCAPPRLRHPERELKKMLEER